MKTKIKPEYPSISGELLILIYSLREKQQQLHKLVDQIDKEIEHLEDLRNRIYLYKKEG
jgi:hypothetical protein